MLNKSEFIIEDVSQAPSYDYTSYFVCGVARDIYAQRGSIYYTQGEVKDIREELYDLYNLQLYEK